MNKKRYEDLTQEDMNNMKNYQIEELKRNYYIRKGIKYGLIIFIALLLIITLFSSFTTVATGYVGVKTRFGKVQDDVITEGLNLKTPYIEKIVRINCKTQKIEQTTEASSKDLQTVTISIALNYNVNKQNANKLYQEIGTEFEEVVIKPSILESVKSIVAKYNAEELITKRAEVSNQIQELLTQKIENRGFDVTEFNTTNIDFSQEFDKAIETKAVKQQEVETAKAELEKQKIDNEKEISKAEKDAKVMELQNKQITDNTLKLKQLEIQEKMINKWSGNLPSTVLNENMMSMLNMNK